MTGGEARTELSRLISRHLDDLPAASLSTGWLPHYHTNQTDHTIIIPTRLTILTSKDCTNQTYSTDINQTGQTGQKLQLWSHIGFQLLRPQSTTLCGWSLNRLRWIVGLDQSAGESKLICLTITPAPIQTAWFSITPTMFTIQGGHDLADPDIQSRWGGRRGRAGEETCWEDPHNKEQCKTSQVIMVTMTMTTMMMMMMNIGQANEIKHNDGEQRSLLAVAWQRTRRGWTRQDRSFSTM